MIIKIEKDVMVPLLANKQLSNQTIRILAALVLIPATATILWLGTPYFDILAILASFLLLKEWQEMSLKSKHNPCAYLLCFCTLGILYLDFSIKKYVQYSGLIIIVFSFIHYYQHRNIKNFAFYLIGTLYICWSLYLIIYFVHEELTLFFLWILTVVWASDSGAYFAGRHFGGPKLAPRISPNKTWSGFIGGIVASVIIGITLGSTLQDLYPSIFQMAIVSAYLSLMSHLGDLLESVVKRYFNVKDSGCLIPGHGGILDRLDSTLLASFATGLLIALGI